MSATQYLEAIENLHAITRPTVAWWEVDGFDLLLTPTIPELPPTLGQFRSTKEEPMTGLFRSVGPSFKTLSVCLWMKLAIYKQ